MAEPPPEPPPHPTPPPDPTVPQAPVDLPGPVGLPGSAVRRYLRRPVLERRLETAPPLTLLQGPPGFGKTTLLVSWLSGGTGRRTVVWVDAGPDLDDPARFWRHLLRALSVAAFGAGGSGGVGREIGPAAGDAGEANAVLRELSRVLRHVQERVVLVVDRFDHIRNRRVVVDLVQLVQRQCALQLFLCLRGRHLVTTLGPASVETDLIGPHDLLLSEAEIGLLAEVLERPVSPEQAARVHQASGGWPAAVRRILECSPPGEPNLSLAHEYVCEVVLPQLGDARVRRDLMRLCLVIRPPARLLRDLFPADQAVAVLDALGLLGLTWSGDPPGEVLAVPAMVRAALHDELVRRDPEGAVAFHARVGAWFAGRAHEPDNPAGHADAATALRHLVAGRAWGELVGLWDRFGTDLLARYPDELHEALAAVPDDVLRTQPGMVIAREVVTALYCAEHDASAALRAYLDTGEQLCVSAHLDALPLPSLLAVAAGYLASLRVKGRFGVAEQFAADVEQRLRTRPPGEEVNHGDMAWFEAQRGLIHTLRGDDLTAIRCYHEAWVHGRRVPGHAAAAYAAANLALTHTVHGQGQEALRWLERLDTVDTSAQWVHDLVRSGASIARGLLALDALDLARAAGELVTLTDRPWGQLADVLWPFAAHLHARHALHDGNPADALVHLADAVRVHQDEHGEPGVAATLLARDRADLLIACGEGNLARRAVGELAPMAAAVPQARLHLLVGEYTDAAAVAAATLWHPDCSERDHLELLLIKAVCALHLDQRRKARGLFIQALERYRKDGVLRAFATIGAEDLRALCALVPGELSAPETAVLAAVRPAFTTPLRLVRLTPQEQRVLVELGRSRSHKDIADALLVSVSAVKAQLRAIYRKLGTTTRQETLLRAGELTLLPEPPPERAAEP